MTTAAICAPRELSWTPSFCSGEQYDSDLGLYYLRARYYNPSTGRFLSRDPEDGYAKDPASLHKYLYANGDPVNGIDPRGHEDLAEVGWLTAGRVAVTVVVTSAIRACVLVNLLNISQTLWSIYDHYDKGTSVSWGVPWLPWYAKGICAVLPLVLPFVASFGGH